MSDYLHELPDYDANAALYDDWLDRRHEQLFSKHFSRGTRSMPATFDGDRYLNELIRAMARDAEREAHKEQADEIMTLGSQRDWVQQPGE